MINDEGKQKRASLRLDGYDYASAGAYFITVCTKERVCLFGEVADGVAVTNEAGRIIQDTWNTLPTRFSGVKTDSFIIMPNHVHGIIAFVGVGLALPGQEGAASSAPTAAGGMGPAIGYALGDVMRAFKSLSALNVNSLMKRTGPLWQRNYYEHIIRDEISLNKIREYIEYNPVMWEIDRENPSRAQQAAPLPKPEPWCI